MDGWMEWKKVFTNGGCFHHVSIFFSNCNAVFFQKVDFSDDRIPVRWSSSSCTFSGKYFTFSHCLFLYVKYVFFFPLPFLFLGVLIFPVSSDPVISSAVTPHCSSSTQLTISYLHISYQSPGVFTCPPAARLCVQPQFCLLMSPACVVVFACLSVSMGSFSFTASFWIRKPF